MYEYVHNGSDNHITDEVHTRFITASHYFHSLRGNGNPEHETELQEKIDPVTMHARRNSNLPLEEEVSEQKNDFAQRKDHPANEGEKTDTTSNQSNAGCVSCHPSQPRCRKSSRG